jgi:hypothetical protein
LLQTQQTAAGWQMRTASLLSTGCEAHQSQILLPKYCPASVCGHANSLSALASAIAWSVRTCAGYRLARTGLVKKSR